MKFLDQLIKSEPVEAKVKGGSYGFYGRPKSIHWQDEKLFLCVFFGVKKNLKRQNQFDVAVEIKRLFQTTYAYNSISDYQSLDEWKEDKSVKIAQLKIAIRVKDNTYKHYLIYKHHNYLGAYERALYDLSVYLEYATPMAIIQMRKRLLKKNKFEWGLRRITEM